MLDADLQKGSGIYPGEEWCNPQEPHAKVSLQKISGIYPEYIGIHTEYIGIHP